MADLLQSYEARIAALERLVGKQALELAFLKEGLRVPHGARVRLFRTPSTAPEAACGLPFDHHADG